jgi:hypothetical protein
MTTRSPTGDRCRRANGEGSIYQRTADGAGWAAPPSTPPPGNANATRLRHELRRRPRQTRQSSRATQPTVCRSPIATPPWRNTSTTGSATWYSTSAALIPPGRSNRSWRDRRWSDLPTRSARWPDVDVGPRPGRSWVGVARERAGRHVPCPRWWPGAAEAHRSRAAPQAQSRATPQAPWAGEGSPVRCAPHPPSLGPQRWLGWCGGGG